MFNLINKTYAANEITNPGITSNIGTKSPGAGLAFYIGNLWRATVTVGGLMVLLYIVWGGLEWMLAGGDKAKIETAQHKITNSIIGLAILVGSYAIIKLIEGIFKINLLQPVFEKNI